MKCLLSVCLIAFSFTSQAVSAALAQSSTTAAPLQKGISVELAVTAHAQPLPDADNESALIVSVTDGGSTYFGVDPITPSALSEKLKASLANRQRNFYLKADARAPYSDVTKVLAAALSAGIGLPMLLTTQRESTGPGAIESPKGLRVLIAASAAAVPEKIGSKKVFVRLFDSGKQGQTLTINGQTLPWAELQSALNQLLQNQSEKVVVVQADGSVPYAQVVRVIDLCGSISAKVVLLTSES